MPTATPAGPDLAAVAWTDGDIAAFIARRARLVRWGWPEAEAEWLAERLVIRDREADARVSCTDCRHYRPGRCGNHAGAGLQAREVGRELAGLLQRCPGFDRQPTHTLSPDLRGAGQRGPIDSAGRKGTVGVIEAGAMRARSLLQAPGGAGQISGAFGLGNRTVPHAEIFSPD